MTPALGYSKMKDSGIPWVGFVPNDWEIVRLQSQLFEVNENNNPVKTTQILSLTNKLGVIPYEDKGNQGNKSKEDLTGYKIAYPDCIVANSMNILIGSVGLSRYYGCVSPVYYVFKAKEDANINFLNYLFSLPSFQKELRKFANGILEIRLRVSAGNILKRKIALPPSKEQLAIVTYLDAQCAKIDEIIAEAKASIEDYKKWKASIIYEAVTKGLDPDVEMKESGVQWIGQMPSTWGLKKAKNCVSITNGSDPKTEGNIPVYGSGAESFKTCGEYKNGPAVLIGRKGATLHIPHYISGRYWNVDTAFDVRAKECFSLKYYYYLACSFDYKYYISQTTLPSMTQTNYNNICLPFPPAIVQEEICRFLDNSIAKIDELITEKQSLISDLESYKKSLIYEVVTGKRRVC